MKLQKEPNGRPLVVGGNSSGVGNATNTHSAYIKQSKVTTKSATPPPAIPAIEKPTFFRSFLNKMQPNTSLRPPTPTTTSSQSFRSRRTARIFALPEAWKTNLFRAQTPTPTTPSAPSTTSTHPKVTTAVPTPNPSSSSLQDTGTTGTTRRNPIPVHWRIEPRASERELLLSERDKREARRDSARSSWGRETGRETGKETGRDEKGREDKRAASDDDDDDTCSMVLEQWIVQHKVLVEDYEDLATQAVASGV